MGLRVKARSVSHHFATTWWLDNGKERTVNQARWRWLDLGGAPGFSLVNVTANDPVALENQVEKMMNDE